MKTDEMFIKPILTEKATKLANNKVYVFEVDSSANKYMLKKSIEQLYSVKVSKIKILNRKGKKRKVGKKMKIKKLTDRKIAFIKIKSGKIDLFPVA